MNWLLIFVSFMFGMIFMLIVGTITIWKYCESKDEYYEKHDYYDGCKEQYRNEYQRKH